ncbi:MAG: hypothetical protein J6X49_04420 [Victivallales bacterium]|nr:hypothetical protein [Victivallales bacterium]
MAATVKNQKKQLTILIVLVIMLVCFTAYQFRGIIKLPTKARVTQLQKKLKEDRETLMIKEREKKAFEEEIATLRTISEPFWEPSNQRSIEQEIQSRFEGIVRDAKLVSKNVKTQKIKSNIRNNVQEIEVRMDFDSLTMQDLAIFFEKLDDFMNRSHKRFYWSSFRLSTTPVRVARMPGQPPMPGRPGMPPGMGGPQSPEASQTGAASRTLKLSLAAKAYALTAEASEFILSNGTTSMPTTTKGAATK